MLKPITLIIGLLLILPAVTAVTITSESGETWIKWSWDTSNYVKISVDGAPDNTTNNQGYFILSALNPSEKHSIQIYNDTDGLFYAENDATTAPAMSTIYLFLVISIVFTFLLMTLRDDVRGIICGLLGTMTSLYLSWISSQALNGFWALGLMLGAINIGVIALVMYEKYGKKPSSWGLDDDE